MKIFNSYFKSSIILHLIFVGFLFSLSACDKAVEETKTETLYVKFVNDSASVATITSIMVQAMGKAGDAGTPSGDWSGNVIEKNQTIAPGEFVFFTLEIPNLHWVRYRLGVDNGSGQELLLHEQSNYQEMNLPITHWGGDERTASTTVLKSLTTENYYTSGYSDWAGIN